MGQVAAVAFVFLSMAVAAFQIALVLGAPWGELTLGGRWRGALPLRVRALPVVSTGLLVFFSMVVVARAGMALDSWRSVAQVLVWGVVAYCALGSVANAATPSRRERHLWLPVVLCMLALSLVVALS